MMRSKSSFESSFLGKIYNILFSRKTSFSFCTSLIYFNLNNNLALSKNKKKETNSNSILIFGNWNLPHNFVSLIDFLRRLNIDKKFIINVVGEINDSNKKIIKKLKLNRLMEVNTLGYINNLDELKIESSYVVSCAKYGSGIPIKCLEIISESKKFQYKPIFSTYCKRALKGLFDNKLIVYPSKGSIDIF